MKENLEKWNMIWLKSVAHGDNMCCGDFFSWLLSLRSSDSCASYKVLVSIFCHKFAWSLNWESCFGVTWCSVIWACSVSCSWSNGYIDACLERDSYLIFSFVRFIRGDQWCKCLFHESLQLVILCTIKQYGDVQFMSVLVFLWHVL